MALSADHEVIDSPEALFLHLYEAHNVEEARDLDPDSAPLQFWLRRHAELEREERPEQRGPAHPSPSPSSSSGSSQPRARPFADPLVEAVAVALAGRHHDERAVRATIASYGEQRLRARFLDPLLDDITAELRGASRNRERDRPQRPPPAPPPAPQPAPAPTTTSWRSPTPSSSTGAGARPASGAHTLSRT